MHCFYYSPVTHPLSRLRDERLGGTHPILLPNFDPAERDVVVDVLSFVSCMLLVVRWLFVESRCYLYMELDAPTPEYDLISYPRFGDVMIFSPVEAY